MHLETPEEALWPGYRMSCRSHLTGKELGRMEFRPDICQVWVSCSDDFVGFGVENLAVLGGAARVAGAAAIRMLEGHLPPLSHVLL